ncbi:hypothetical protein COBT_004244, partial [Conglomerata obtusa]
MVEIAVSKSTTSGVDKNIQGGTVTSGTVDEGQRRTKTNSEFKMDMMELKMKIEDINDGEKRILYALKSLGEDGCKWYIELSVKPCNWEEMRQMLLL